MFLDILKDISKKIVERDAKGIISRIIITGSYAVQLLEKNDYQQEGLKDYNLYVLIDGELIDIYSMNLIIHKSIKEIGKKHRLKFSLDIHPFAFFQEEINCKVQFTTRAISIKEKNEYANYCWNGWKENVFILYENKNFANPFLKIPLLQKDQLWEKAISQALSNYKNKVLNLPLFSIKDETCEKELIRYTKEIIKDGIQIVSSDKEYSERKHYEYLHRGKNGILEFYKEKNILLDKYDEIKYILSVNDRENRLENKLNNYEIAEIFFLIYNFFLKKLSERNCEILKEQMQWY